MKRVTIELEEDQHKKLVDSANINNRSLKGELKTILQNHLAQNQIKEKSIYTF